MGGYYEETLDEIGKLVSEGHFEAAMLMIDKELSMPYVPEDVEKQLAELRKEAVWRLSEKTPSRERSIGSILAGLKKKPEDQLAAASALSGRNLREICSELSAYLSGDPFPEAASLVIEAIAEQEVPEEFTYVKDGLEYTFWGDSLTPVSESEGFLKADRILKDLLANDHPDYYEMCRTLLIHEVFMYLPLSYEEEEADELADGILKEVSGLMDDGELYREIKKS